MRSVSRFLRFHLATSLLCAFFGILLFTFPACTKKKDDPVPAAPAPGSASGIISPTGSVVTVTATSSTGATYQVTPDPPTGAFTFPTLPPGTYTISFSATTGYTSPPSLTTTVTSGGNASVGTVTAQSSIGSASGTISPAGSVTMITATSSTGTTYQATPDATTGAFTFPSLPAGTYTISFTAAAGYANPTSLTNTIVAGANTAIGTINVLFAAGTVRGTLTWRANGTTYSTNQLIVSYLSAAGYSMDISGVIMNGATLTELKFRFDHGGPGSYLVTGGSPGTYLTFDYLTFNNSVLVSRYRAHPQIGGTGNAYVLSYDHATRPYHLTGTFGFSGVRVDSNGYPITWASNLSVSNGTFDLYFY